MNRRMPNGTYGGVRGRGCEAPAYSMTRRLLRLSRDYRVRYCVRSLEICVEYRNVYMSLPRSLSENCRSEFAHS